MDKARRALAPALARLKKALPKDVRKVPQGALADLLYDLRSVVKQVSLLVDDFNDVTAPAVKNIEEFFVDTLKVGESSGLQGMRSRVQITEAAIPVVAAEDWPKLWKHITKTQEWELLNKAINREAVRERWEAHKQVPGVGKFISKKVSCTKLGRAK